MSNTQLRAFRILQDNQTVSLVTTAASQTLTLPQPRFTSFRNVRVVNSGAEITFFNFSSATAATLATSAPLLPNSVEVFTIAGDVDSLRVIGTAGGNTVYVTIGEGL